MISTKRISLDFLLPGPKQMREIVLNHASFASPDEHTCLDWLIDLAVGMSTLSGHSIVQNGIRACRPLQEIWCLQGYSLYDAIVSLRATARDEHRFLLTLVNKAQTLLIGLDATVKERFLMCETTSLSPDDGEPLLLCAIQDWIAISCPSAPDWELDTLNVTFRELLRDDEWQDTQQTIDNLAYASHATQIVGRHRERVLSALTPGQQWDQRETVFPHLLFGLDVDDNVRESDHLTVILSRLQRLNNSAAFWKKNGGPIPPWSSDVSPESGSTMSDPKLSAKRIFRSHDGTPRLFDWHAKFGSMRIHLRFDPASRTVEIGYIGPHLPLN